MRHSAPPGREIIQHRPAGSERRVREHLRLARAKIPMLNAGRNCDVWHLMSPGPFQRCCRRLVSVFAVAYFVDDGKWNQDGGCDSLDQIETADARKEDEW